MADIDRGKIGARLRDARKALEITQQELSKKLGVSRAALAQWETGLTYPSLEMIELLAKELHATPEWIAFATARSIAPTTSKYVEDPKFLSIREMATSSNSNEAEWKIPRNLFDLQKDISFEELVIFELKHQTGSSEIRAAKRAIVDTEDHSITSGGTFVYWTGDDPMIGNFSRSLSNPTETITIRDGLGIVAELPFTSLHIAGRVVGMFTADSRDFASYL